ncbi:hypothetical protein G4G31_12135 [Massilia sp. Se16.2.3]|nr:hypothetical protein G4G31_12135 [Massilia sp. Se16.2.3]
MRARRRQAGLTLPELLVALALSLGVLLAAGILLAGAQASYLAHADAADVDDSGRFALALVGRAVRQAAFVDWEHSGAAASAATAPAAIAGLDDRSLGRNTAAISAPLSEAVNGSDVLALRYPGAGKAPDGDGSVLNCAGFAVHGMEEGWSIFYVAKNADGVAELRCKYRGTGSWSADAIVANVDGFQVLYGVDMDVPGDGVPNRYLNATALAALDAALVPGGATAAERDADFARRTWWKRVTNVQVALLLHGERPAQGAVVPADHAMFGLAYAETFGSADPGVRLVPPPPAGGKRAPLRRLFTAVFAVGAAVPQPWSVPLHSPPSAAQPSSPCCSRCWPC